MSDINTMTMMSTILLITLKDLLNEEYSDTDIARKNAQVLVDSIYEDAYNFYKDKTVKMTYVDFVKGYNNHKKIGEENE